MTGLKPFSLSVFQMHFPEVSANRGTAMNTPTTQDWENTTRWYDANAQDFISRADKLDPSNDLLKFTAKLAPGAKILDLGCGTGRDLETFFDLGFDAHGLDGSEELVRHAIRRLGDPARVRHQSFQDFDDAPASWDGIWAMASLIHVPRECRHAIFETILASLKPGGIFMAYFKSGEDDIIDEAGRAISLMTPSDALGSFMPVLPENARVTAEIVERTDSRGNFIPWTAVEVQA